MIIKILMKIMDYLFVEKCLHNEFIYKEFMEKKKEIYDFKNQNIELIFI